jgi:hypothetical protein
LFLVGIFAGSSAGWFAVTRDDEQKQLEFLQGNGKLASRILDDTLSEQERVILAENFTDKDLSNQVTKAISGS